MPNGKGKIFNENDTIIYEGDFINGTYEGKGHLSLGNEIYYYGYFKNGEFHGKGILYHKEENKSIIVTENIDVSDDYLVTLSINYKGEGTICFYDLINTDDQYGVMAYGLYTLVGNELTANYLDVDCKDANWEPFTYHGFSDGKSKTVVYTIQSCDGQKLVMKDESGKTLNYVKYGDVK